MVYSKDKKWFIKGLLFWVKDWMFGIKGLVGWIKVITCKIKLLLVV